MTNGHPKQMELARFTLWSLQFTSTSVGSWRSERLLRIINRVYLNLIRSGWPVPLSFALDVTAMLLHSMAAPREFPVVQWKRCPQPIRDLSNRYRSMLARLRRDPVFSRMADLLREIPEPEDQDNAVAALLPFLVKAAGGFQNIYSFRSREMTVRVTKIAPRVAGLIWIDSEGKARKKRFSFRDVIGIMQESELQALMDVLHLLCDHFENTSLLQILTPERQLVIEIAARTPRGAARVDYRFLSWLLNRPVVNSMTEETPSPRFVREFVPTNVLETEGNSGGYIDVYRRSFGGSLSAVLPAELSLWDSRQVMLQKLLNEGVLTYVRENDEYIERELRVLVCMIVDNSPRMVQDTATAQGKPGRGLTPWMRARALALVLTQELARWMPRSDVRVDCGIYLWSQGDRDSDSTRRSPPTCQAEFDLFSWSRAEAADRLTFLSAMTRRFPEIFYGQVSQADAEVRPEQEASPYTFLKHRQQTRRYHCRHLIYLSSSGTLRDLLRDMPGDLHLETQESGSDSIHLITCDTDRTSFGIAGPDAPAEAWQMGAGRSSDGGLHLPGQIGEERLLHQIASTVILKGAGKSLMSQLADGLEDDLLP